MPKIGFIGLGLMGSNMVERLQGKGYALTVLANRSRTNIDAAVARGALEAGCAREVAQKCDIVMLCMGTSAHVESRMYGDDGVIAGLSAGKVVIDFGTSLPGSTRKIAKDVAIAGAQYLDAPLGRTPAHAKDGLLNIMASGDEAAFAKVKPVLEDLGENIFHLGTVGTGHSIKLLNNFFGMTLANAWAEAMAMADVAGVERQTVYDVVSAGPLHCGMMDFVTAYAVDKDASKLGFSISNALKDVGYYREMARDSGFKTVMSEGAFNAMSAAVKSGQGDDMVSQMVDYYTTRQT